MVEKKGEKIIDKENLRRALRSELVGSGIVYRSYGTRTVVHPLTEAKPSYPVVDAEGVEYAGNGRLLIAAMNDNQRQLVMWKEGEILWEETDLDKSYSVQRKGKKGNFLVSVQKNGTDYVREYDVQGDIVNEVSASALGLGGINGLDWSMKDPDHFWVASGPDDKVVKTSWDGEIDISITKVSAPRGIQCYNGWVWICDMGNNRVILVATSDKSIGTRHPFPNPLQVEWNGQIVLMGGSGPHGGHRNGVWAFHHSGGGEPLGFIPIKGDLNAINFHPTKPHRVLLVGSGTILDMDISYLYRGHTTVPPLSWNPMTGTSIAADSPKTTNLSLDWLHPKKTIHIKATESGTVTIQKANYKDHDGFWDGTWSDFDSFSISADTAEEYKSNYLLGAFRMKVDLDADGSADMWVHQSA